MTSIAPVVQSTAPDGATAIGQLSADTASGQEFSETLADAAKDHGQRPHQQYARPDQAAAAVQRFDLNRKVDHKANAAAASATANGERRAQLHIPALDTQRARSGWLEAGIAGAQEAGGVMPGHRDEREPDAAAAATGATAGPDAVMMNRAGIAEAALSPVKDGKTPTVAAALNDFLQERPRSPSAQRSEHQSAPAAALTERSSDSEPSTRAVPVAVTQQATHFAPAKQSHHVAGVIDASDAAALDAPLVAPHQPSPLQRDRMGHSAGSRPAEKGARTAGIAGEAALPSGAGAANLTPGQQIFTSIIDEIGGPPRDAQSAGTAASPSISWPATGPALRTLAIQLAPASLGPVTVVLSRSDGALRIKLDAERIETIGLVEQGLSELTSRLTGAGYAIDEVLVGQTPDAARSANSSSQPWHAGGQSLSNMPGDPEPRRGGSEQRFGRSERSAARQQPPAAALDQSSAARLGKAPELPWPRVAGARFLKTV